MAANLESNSNASVLVQIYPVPGMIHPAPLTHLPMTLPTPPTPLPMNYYPYPYSYALGMLPETPQCSPTPQCMTQTILSPTLMQMPVNVPLQMPVQMTMPQINKPTTIKPAFEHPKEPTKNCEVNRKQQKVKNHLSEDELDESYHIEEDGGFNSCRNSGGIAIDTSRSTISSASEISYVKPVQTIAYRTKNHVRNCEPEPVQPTYDMPKFVDILANTVSPINSFEHDKPSAFKDIYLNVSLPEKLKKRRKTRVQRKKGWDDLATMLGNLFKHNAKLQLSTHSSLEVPVQRSKNTRKKTCSPIRIDLLSKPRILKTDGRQIKPLRFPKPNSMKTWKGSDLQSTKLNSTSTSFISKDGKSLPQQGSTDVRSIKMIYKRNECDKDQSTKDDRSRSSSGTCYTNSETANSLEDLLRSYPLDADCRVYNELKKIMQHTQMTTGKRELNRCMSDKLLNTPHKFSRIFRNYTVEMMPSILYMSSTIKNYKPKSNLLNDKATNSTVRPQDDFLKGEPSTSAKSSKETYINSCHYCNKFDECSAAKCCMPPRISQASLDNCEDNSNSGNLIKTIKQSNAFDGKGNEERSANFTKKMGPTKVNDTCCCRTKGTAANNALICSKQISLKAACLKAKCFCKRRKCGIKRNTPMESIANSDPLKLTNTKAETKPLCCCAKTKTSCRGKSSNDKRNTQELMANNSDPTLLTNMKSLTKPSYNDKKKTQELMTNNEPSITNIKSVTKPSSSPIKADNKIANTFDDNDTSKVGPNYSKKARKKVQALIPFGQTPSAKRLQHLCSLKKYNIFPFWKRCYNLFCNPCCEPCCVRCCCCSCACGCSYSCQPRLCQPNCEDCDCNYCCCNGGN